MVSSQRLRCHSVEVDVRTVERAGDQTALIQNTIPALSPFGGYRKADENQWFPYLIQARHGGIVCNGHVASCRGESDDICRASDYQND